MMRRIAWLAAGVLVAAFPLSGAAQTSPDEVPLTAASLIVEINATDGDAGIQPFLDGDPWTHAIVYWPDGRKLFEVRTMDDLQTYGLTELFTESSEPPFDEFPLERFKELFPDGNYRFEATSVNGTLMAGTATLSHVFPAGPTIVAPEEDATIPASEIVVAWEPVIEPAGIEIAGYEVLVVQEEPVLRTFSADLPATATTVTVPIEFVQPGIEYKVEVIAVEANGNKTLTEHSFTAG
jgi:hypothetical protein